MLKITRLRSSGGAANYYSQEDLGNGSYYAAVEINEPGLIWGGKAAAMLGLKPASPADPDHFEKLLEGINPDRDGPPVSRLDARLRDMPVPETGSDDKRLNRPAPDERAAHQPGFDLCFSAPKGVSLLSLVGGDERLDIAHREAVAEAMAYVEEHLAIYRQRDGEGQVRSHLGKGLVWASTEHGLSRSADPQKHTHVLLMNMVSAQSGEYRALETRELYRYSHLIGSLYLSALRERVNGLGYHTRDSKGGEGNFEITGISKSHLDAFSRRSAQIEDNIVLAESKLGRDLHGSERQLMRMRERPAKPQGTRDELVAGWKERASEVGLNLDRLHHQALARDKGRHVESPFEGRVSGLYSGLLKFANPQDMPHETARGAVRQGLAQMEERAAVFTRHDVLQAAMKAADYRFGGIAAYEKPLLALQKSGRIREADKVVVGGITTARAVALEHKVVERLQAERGAARPFPASDIESLLTVDGFERLGMTHVPSDSQTDVIVQVLGSSDGFIAVTGPAGTGKTSTFNAIGRAVADLSGGQQKLLALAPTHKAVEALNQEAGLQADTVTHFLNGYEDAKARGNLDEMKGVYGGHRLLVDEASMLSNPQMGQLLEAKKTLGIVQLIVSGDERQLPSIQAGAPLKLALSAGIETAALTEIRRQKDDNLKSAVYALAYGEPAKALPLMMPYIKEVEPADDRSLALTAVRAWQQQRTQGNEATVVVATHAMRAEVTMGIRKVLVAEGKLSDQGVSMEVLRNVGLTQAELANSHNYSLGQTLNVFKGDKAANIRAGERIRVNGIDHTNNRLVGTGLRGRPVSLSLSEMAERGKLGYGVSAPDSIGVATGDRMVWTGSDRNRGILNGSGFEVVRMARGHMVIRGDDGAQRTVSYTDPILRSIGHAYAITADKAQGQTYPHVIAVLPSRLGDFANNARAYVMASRPSETFTLITDNAKALFRKMGEHDGINRIALEHIGKNYDKAMPVTPDALNSPGRPQPPMEATQTAEQKSLEAPSMSGRGYALDKSRGSGPSM